MARISSKFVLAIVVVALIARTNQERLRVSSAPTQMNADAVEKRSNSSDSTSVARHTDNTDERTQSLPYFQASLPMRVYECLRVFSILRCTKLFILQKMEERKSMSRTGNLTRDFLDQFFDAGDRQDSLIANKYANMTDEKLNQCLVVRFQRFFKHRDIKLHFLPGVMVKIVPSRDNKLSFTLKKSKKSKKRGRAYKIVEEIDETLGLDVATPETLPVETPLTKQSDLGLGGPVGIGGGGGPGGIRRKNKKGSSFATYKNTILQMAVPVMIMPAILLGSVLPFLLPMLKLATIMTILLNNSAFIAALIYAARTHANAQDEQQISYPPQGYF
uniref:Trafficking kinesin-binding protein 1 n=1 Tax=Zeugodacus cucurbitae TaxID=28588 RepID=A0A0A1WLI3_ZEUCU